MTQDRNHIFVKTLRGVLAATIMLLTSNNALAQVTVKGSVFGGGNEADVQTNTVVNISAGKVEGNVYGGGNLGDVGTIDKADIKNYTWSGSGDEDASNDTGICTVNITGGTVGDDENVSTEKGNVFGAGKGMADSFWCEKGMVYKTSVSISKGTVYGNVYGGGQLGRVENNTEVTIDGANDDDTEITGDVFGAGAGVETHGYSALVRGNASVTIQGYAKIRKSVYGGGEKASVGRYTLVDEENQSQYPGLEIGMPGSVANNGSGECVVIIKGNAEIGPEDDMQMKAEGGPDDAGHVFGAGMGAVPQVYTYNDKTTMPKRMMSYTSSLYLENQKGITWEYSDEEQNYVWEYFDTEAKYLTFIETMALTTQTQVTVEGSAFVKGSVYGGSENGFVQHDTKVMIKGGQIGAGEGETAPYADNKFVNPATTTINNENTLKACAHWDYEYNGATYDKFAGTTGYDPKGGAITAKDGHTFYGNVFGGGSGYYPYAPGKWHRKAGSVAGHTRVEISGGHILTNVYGGNEQTDVGTYTHDENDSPFIADGGTCTIIMSGGTIGVPRTATAIEALPTIGHLYGAGKGDKRILFNTWTNVGATNVSVTGGIVYGNVYGGGEDGHVMGNAVMTISEADANKPTVIGSVGNAGLDGNVFGGGQGSPTALTAGVVGGSVNLNVQGGQMLGSVYGGGRIASVGTYFAMATDPRYGKMQDDVDDNEETTETDESVTHGHLTVNLTGGTIKQNVYGGCMGENADESKGITEEFAAKLGISKTVIVNLNKDVENTARGCAVKGDIFGCNNTNASPQQSVTVHVYATQNAEKTQIANTSGESPVTDAKREGFYDVRAVYGGGNLAAYVPTEPNTSKTQVIIDGCDKTSIQTVYGGGNAAAVPETNVTINAAYEIGYVFGGGNGKDDIAPGVTNPGADVGQYKNGTETVTYGTGNANSTLIGGLIHEAYGGSNTKGVIKGSLNQTTEPDTSEGACELIMDKVVGAGKYADIDGDVNMTLSCQPNRKINELFAGADEANVNGNITLNITNGHFGKVFGGNNLGGAVKGKITVNVEETECQPIKIDNLYLGGNQAAYSVYGYYESEDIHPVTGKKILKPRVSANDSHTAVSNPATDATHTFPYAQPELNIISCTYIGNVFGGGLGKEAKMYANPTVNVNMVPGAAHAATAVPAMMAELELDVSKTAANPDNLGIIRNIYGGGDAADIEGNTTVNIAVEYVVKQVTEGANVTSYYTRSGAGTTADPFVYTAATGTADEETTYYEKKDVQGAAYIIGSVFGGGNAADVLGNTNVTMSGGYVFNGIFGGGYAGNVGTFTRSSALEHTEVYGHTAHASKCIGKPISCKEGTGKCTVLVNGGQIGPISVATEGMNRPKAQGGPVPEGWVWGAGQGLIEDPAKEPDTHFKSYVGSTDVTIGGTALVMESIIGGGEFGRVLGNTKVTITGQCQIGVGANQTETIGGVLKPKRYTDDQFVNPLTTTITSGENGNALAECSHFPYGEDTNEDGIKDTFLPYDPYYDKYKAINSSIATSDLAPASTASPSDGKTWIGCVFAGGSGYMPYEKEDGSGYDWCSSAGLVEGNTELIISGGHILTNVYGGNEVTNVKGTCKVTMTGGTIGVPRTVDQIINHPLTCYLFGAGKGDPRPHFNTETNVQDVEIDISGGIIYGSVFGGGEDGHVERNVKMTIGKDDHTGPIIGTWGTTYVDGNIFGGGRGFSGDAYTAGNVAGSVDLKIKGGTMLGSIYGGGRLGSVGYGLYPPSAGETYYGAMRPDNTGDDANNTAIANFKRGYVDVEISGGTIGNSYEYIIPSAANTPTGLTFADIASWTDDNWKTWTSHNNIPLTEFDKETYRLKHTKGGNVFAGGMGRLYQLDGITPISAVNWWKVGCVKQTKLTVKGGTIKSNVYGGGELGAVKPYVNGNTVQGGTTEIIVKNENNTQIGTEIKDGSNATQYTFGSVYGGGYGSTVEKLFDEDDTATEYDNPKYVAGLVYGDTKIDMQGGKVLASIYGGGETASVNGSTDVAVSGGSVGKDKVGNTQFGGATMGNVYGGGSGHPNIVRCGRILKNSKVTISGSDTKIYHNIYGGGAYGTVGDFVYDVRVDEATQATKVFGVSDLNTENTGKAEVIITGGTIGIDGHENGMIFGSSRGDVNKPGERDDHTAWVYDAFVTIGTQGAESGPAIKGSIYGSGENGHTFHNTDVIIHSGKIGIDDVNDPDGGAAYAYRGNVYGGGCGTDKYYSGSIPEGHTANDGNGDTYNPLAGIVYGNTTVTIDGGTVVHNVYGAGAMGSVGKATGGTTSDGKTTINISGGTIGVSGTVGDGNVYGAARGDLSDNTDGLSEVQETEVNIKPNTIDGKPEATIKGSVFGGGEAGIVKGDVAVNVSGGNILQDVYGGGALADTQTSNWDATSNTWATGMVTNGKTTYKTTVNLLDGTIGGDAYGGGLGQKTGFNGGTSDIEAMVYGDVTVNLGDEGATKATAFNISYDETDDKDENNNLIQVVKSGRVFGCNNLNGSPQGDVTVNVYKTVTGNVGRTDAENSTAPAQEQRASRDANVPHTYELAAVYGGGNLADYTATGKKASVTIHTCDVSVQHVYGGGNAAAVPETDVLVKGAWEIDHVFGGGNGKDKYKKGNAWIANAGADVGSPTTPGNTNTLLIGGYIHEAYGGSNEKGTIWGNATINTDADADCACALELVKLYGAGKNADIEGDLIVVLECAPETKTEEIYGGAENANVKGNVELTITSGTFGKVFGGNNQSGAIFGHIILNIEETGCRPIIIDELYGCGNNAAYSVYGYKNGGTDWEGFPIYVPRTSTDDGTAVTFDGKPHTVPDATTGQYDDPEVNIISCTRIGKVFGGGWGSGAIVYGNPTVNIDQIYGKAYSDADKTQYDAVATSLGEIGDVFGGGNEANVVGNTNVNIGTKKEVWLHQSVDANGNYTMYPANTGSGNGIPVVGANITGNVYGGGNEAEVTGDTNVNIGKKSE